ncbi:MAG: winged helix-turn-helix transcriptional regulator [Clostridiales bacterium]|nr:winged helix-turn-helix transcriptional regulator [Clostridiales bacterium]
MKVYKGKIITKAFDIISKLPDRFYIYEFRRKYYDVTYPFLTRVLKKLEEHGLIESEKTKKMKYYSITDKGREARELARKFINLIS